MCKKGVDEDMSRYGRRSSNDDDMSGCLVYAIIAIIAMPIVGLYLIFEGDTDGKKAAGVVLLILSLLFWIYTKC